MTKVINITKSKKVKLDWVSLDADKRIPIFYNSKVKIVNEMVEYGLFVYKNKTYSSVQAYRSAIDEVGYHLIAFLQFLDERELNWKNVADNELLAFRDWLFNRSLDRNTAKSDLSRKRTINRYMRTVYNYFLWSQEVEGLIKGKLGWPSMSIKSQLPNKHKHPEIKYINSNLYPLCFQKCGEKSRYAFQYVASSTDFDLLLEHFFETNSIEVAERNALILHVVNCLGFRQGSMHPLKIYQFDEEVLNYASKNNIAWITPKLQKFGNENSFEVPYPIILQIYKYIKGPRAELLIKNGWTEIQCKEALFIDTVHGRPLARKAISEIFSRAFKAIGAPRGSGIHSFRRKFTEDLTDVEIAVRKREDRSADPMSIAVVIKRGLGHNSLGAQEAYARSIGRGTNNSLERTQQLRIQELERQITILRSNK